MAYWEDRIFDPYEEDEPETVTCKVCGVDNLSWSKNPSDGRWFLSDDAGKPHICNVLSEYRKRFG